MSIFNEKRWLAFETGKFICAKCGATMKFTDKWEDKLLCPKRGYEIELELYGIDDEEEYDALYPILSFRQRMTKSQVRKKTLKRNNSN